MESAMNALNAVGSNFISNIEHKWLKSLCYFFATLWAILMVSMAANHDTVTCVRLFIELTTICVPLLMCLIIGDIGVSAWKSYIQLKIAEARIAGDTQQNFDMQLAVIEQAKRKWNKDDPDLMAKNDHGLWFFLIYFSKFVTQAKKIFVYNGIFIYFLWSKHFRNLLI